MKDYFLTHVRNNSIGLSTREIAVVNALVRRYISAKNLADSAIPSTYRQYAWREVAKAHLDDAKLVVHFAR